MAWKTKTKSFLIFLSDAPGHFSKALLNKSEQKTKKSHPNPPSNHLLRTFKVWKIYIFGCHLVKVFLKVLEQQQRHLSPKKSQAKLCVISLKKKEKRIFHFSFLHELQIRIKRYLSLQFCITSRKISMDTENVSNCAHFSVPLENKRWIKESEFISCLPFHFSYLVYPIVSVRFVFSSNPK